MRGRARAGRAGRRRRLARFLGCKSRCARRSAPPRAEIAVVRNRSLHDALHAFVEQAAWQLAADTADGAEVPFELVEARGRRGASLYSYRPLTEQFIRSRLAVLGRLPAWAPAAAALEGQGGLEAYLRLRGEPRVPSERGEQADAVLRSFLGALFEEASEFVLEAERFERAYDQLELTLFETRAPRRGRGPAARPRHRLAGGAAGRRAGPGARRRAVRGARRDRAPGPHGGGARRRRAGDALGGGRAGGAAAAHGGAPALPAAADRAAALRARRLRHRAARRGRGSTAAPGSWRRSASAAVPRPRRASSSPRPRTSCARSATWWPGARRARGSWRGRCGRFEMGCERRPPFEALTDYLLALRALLEPEGPGSGLLARRLAAHLRDGRRARARWPSGSRTRSRWSARSSRASRPPSPASTRWWRRSADHLRALLRDVVCGHLDSDLVRVADEIAERDRPVTPPRAARRPGHRGDRSDHLGRGRALGGRPRTGSPRGAPGPRRRGRPRRGGARGPAARRSSSRGQALDVARGRARPARR